MFGIKFAGSDWIRDTGLEFGTKVTAESYAMVVARDEAEAGSLCRKNAPTRVAIVDYSTGNLEFIRWSYLSAPQGAQQEA